MSQIDSITLGESVSVVSPCDEALYSAVKDIVWQAALSESGAHSGVKKLTVDMSFVKRLRIRCRVALVKLTAGRSAESVVTGPELHWMCVNDYLFSGPGCGFRLPMGAEPIHRTNSGVSGS